MTSVKSIPVYNIQQHCYGTPVDNFKVAPFSDARCTASEFEEDHRHEYFEIIWLKAGTGIHQIDMIDHAYEGSVLFFLAPGQVHKITQHKKSEGYVLKFKPGVFNQEKDFAEYVLDTCLFDNMKSCPIISIPEQMYATIDDLFSRFSSEFNEQLPDADIVLSAYLKILTTHIRRIKNSRLSNGMIVNEPQYDLFRKFKIAVEQHYKTKHAVHDYANYLDTPARTLNTLTRKYVDKSALEVIQDRILLEAKRRLYHNNTTVKELCYELGFEDPAYFTRFFKKNVGSAPQHFKISKSESFK